MDKELRIGIIGPGHIANKMASTIKRVNGFCNYAVASRSKEKADAFKAKYGFQKAYYSYEEMLYSKKKIGEIKSMTAKFMVPLMHKERVTSRKLGGGVIMDIGIYPLTFIFRTLGFDYDSYNIDSIEYKDGVDIKEQLSFKYKNGAVGTCKVDGTSKLSLTVKIQGDKGTMNIDMVNCPNIITTFNKCGIMTSCKFTKPKYGGFEYELYACKKALQEGKIECEEWSHKKSIAAAKIIDDIFNSENALK